VTVCVRRHWTLLGTDARAHAGRQRSAKRRHQRPGTSAPVDGVPTIDLVELDTTVDVDGVDEAALQKHAEAAEASCAVSRALAGVAEIRVTAHPSR
jgi:organic hydroperoxide reductase OsmC/OhrA